jgi:hypothetical protein
MLFQQKGLLCWLKVRLHRQRQRSQYRRRRHQQRPNMSLQQAE